MKMSHITRRKFIKLSCSSCAALPLVVSGIPVLKASQFSPASFRGKEFFIEINGEQIGIMPNTISYEIQGMVTDALKNSEGIEFKQKGPDERS